MKHRLFILSALAGAALAFGSCSNYLDETADRSGNAYIYHMDQLYGLMGQPSLYLGSTSEEQAMNGAGAFMQEQYLMGDGIRVSPDFYLKGNPSMFTSASYAYNMYSWEDYSLKNDYQVSGFTWKKAYAQIYTFNTVLENLDNVEQTTRTVYDQVKGEACFGRAFYHFMLLTQYCRWEEDAPGIGYRDNTSSTATLERETVAYTLGRIYADLDSAEVCLTRAGRTAFDAAQTYRPTMPTVQALRARIALYRGDYDTALTNAENALKGYGELEVIAQNPNYTLMPMIPLNYLDQDSVPIASMSGFISLPMNVMTLYNQATLACPEIMLPCLSADVSTWCIPLSESFYNLFTDKVNDARWTLFYSSNYSLGMANGLAAEITGGGISWETQQWLEPWDKASYWHFYSQWGATNVVGMTTAEMYLTQAECLARKGQTAEAAEVLKTLRRTRFTDQTAADNIGGSVQEVLDERSREMGPFWRFYEAKRLNGAENAGIELRRQVLTDITDLNSVTEIVIPANDLRWALPINEVERQLLGWEQNAGWE